ncbi:hypothetical protein CB0940_01940 [Cercospora beticola]|uniref:Uncharacterized protein n=1 Tax=Cercospora beticola TaxID=122368 RepID=A0A2G5I7R3_CERBT|nr:hypothetical protein CB0940_01940 [Cercospora beticola]PIB00847.1 hypothetical protein CB0940_01940 [Cercospora beticola]WPA97404.1 hypothetical protein RHO25_002014 [Cercospora beticola]
MAFGNSSFNSNTKYKIEWDSEAVCVRHGNHTNGECRAQNNPNAKCVLHGGHSNRDCRSQASRAPPVRFPAPLFQQSQAPRSPQQGSYLTQAPRPPQPANPNSAWGLAASQFAEQAEKNRLANIQRLEKLNLERERGGAAVQPVQHAPEGNGYRFKETFKYTGAKKGVPEKGAVGGGMEQGKVEETPAPRRTVVPPHVAHAERLKAAKLREQQGGGGEKEGK